jgi:hypothetical protein
VPLTIGPLQPAENIDFDKVRENVLNDMRVAMNGWVRGAVHEEAALLSRLIERLGRHRHGCDVGANQHITVKVERFILHRRGARQRDHFGSDFAVTIEIPSSRLIKTAFFQLKIYEGENVEIQAHQVDDAKCVPEVFERGFVLAINRNTLTYRICKLSDIAPRAGTSVLVRTANWHSLSDWVPGWFQCQHGPTSDQANPNRIEARIQQFLVTEQPDLFFEAAEAKPPGPWFPAQAWLKYRFSEH